MDYQLIGKDKEINVFIDESAKKDFMDLMQWDEKTFNKHTKKIEKSNQA